MRLDYQRAMELRPLTPRPLATLPLAQVIPSHSPDPWVQAVADSYLASKQESGPLLPALSKSDLATWRDLASTSADGLTRSHIHWMAPQALPQVAAQRNWEMREDGTPIADVVVIGAGPGGLATGYHLAQGGARVVTLEAGYAGQAFSDAGAGSVHAMRTNRLASSLIRTGTALQDLAAVLGLPANLGVIVHHARQGREQLESRTGHQIQGVAAGGDLEREVPASRGELFAHFQQVADHLARGCDNSLLLERSPVSRVEKQGDLFYLETQPGHKVCARKLVLATGLVQPGGSNARIPACFQQLASEHPQQFQLLGDDQALAQEGLDSARVPILADRLLGQNDVQRYLRGLAPDSPVAVIGSGESAVKGALEVLSQNPQLKVHLFTKSPLEVAQVQIPGENMHPVVLERAPQRPDYGAFSMQRNRQLFGTPITPRTMLHLLEQQEAGRLHVYELGRHFDLNSIQRDSDGSLSLQHPEIARALQQQQADYRKHGLAIEIPLQVPAPAAWISAAGYEPSASQLTPVAAQLVDQGLLSFQEGRPEIEGLTASACSDLAFNTAGVQTTAADGSIPGMAVRGRQLAEHWLAELPQRERPPADPPLPNPGADWSGGYSEEDFRGFVRHRGLAPNWAAGWEDRDRPPDVQAQFDFPDPERFLRGLATRPSETLSPAEQLTLQRARQLQQRLGAPGY